MTSLIFCAILITLFHYSESCFRTPGTTTPAPVAACRSCAGNLILISQAGFGAKPMDGDVIDRTTAACATRTFTCLGPVAGNPNIEINKGQGVIQDGENGTPVDGKATFTLTCNAAGNAWVYMGVTITQVECASG